MHDAYGRSTPYEISLPGREFADDRFPRVESEAEERGVDLMDPGGFVLLGSTGEVLEELQVGGEDPELLHQYGALLFHNYHFWKAGEPFYLLEAPVARFLVEGGVEAQGWTPRGPGPAGYVQLPRHLFWSHAGDDGPAEPLDGFYWTLDSGDAVSLLVVMGLRDDQPGFSVVALPPLPVADAPVWMEETAREEGEDFSTTLPGGELDRLYSLVSTGEVLKLAARTFWYMDQFAGGVGQPEGAPEVDEGPRPSTLPFRRVTLRGEEGS